MLDDLVDCKICYEKYSATSHLPKMLNCHHSFCLDCLEKIKRTDRGGILCPHCRQETPIQIRTGVKGLPNNIYALQILDAIEKGMATEEMAKVNYDKCNSHPDLFCDKFCTQCNTSLCWKCGVEHKCCLMNNGSPSSDVILPIEKVARRNVSSLRDSVLNLEGILKNLVNSSEEIPTSINTLDDDRRSLRNDIQSSFARILEMVQGRESQLLENVNNAFSHKRERLTRLQEINTNKISRIRQVISDSSSCINGESYSDVIHNALNLLHACQSISDEPTAEAANIGVDNIGLFHAESISDTKYNIVFSPVSADVVEYFVPHIGVVYIEKNSASGLSFSSLKKYICSIWNSVILSVLQNEVIAREMQSIQIFFEQQEHIVLFKQSILRIWSSCCSMYSATYQMRREIMRIFRFVVGGAVRVSGMGQVLAEARLLTTPYASRVSATYWKYLHLYSNLRYPQLCIVVGLGLIRAVRVVLAACKRGVKVVYEHYKNKKIASPEVLQSFYRRYPLLAFPRIMDTSSLRSNFDSAGGEATSSTLGGIVEAFDDGVEEEKSEQVDEPVVANHDHDAVDGTGNE